MHRLDPVVHDMMRDDIIYCPLEYHMSEIVHLHNDFSKVSDSMAGIELLTI